MVLYFLFLRKATEELEDLLLGNHFPFIKEVNRIT